MPRAEESASRLCDRSLHGALLKLPILRENSKVSLKTSVG